MTRTRIAAVAALLAVSMLWAAPGALAQSETPPPDLPPIVVDQDSAAEGSAAAGDAWTFRFLVPTVLAMAVLAVTATVVLYGVRVRGRYRVVR